MPGHCSPSGQPTNIMFVVTLYFRQPKYRLIRLDGSISLAWLLLFQENENTALEKNQKTKLVQGLNSKVPSILYNITKNISEVETKFLTSPVHTQYKRLYLQWYCLMHLCLIIFV